MTEEPTRQQQEPGEADGAGEEPTEEQLVEFLCDTFQKIISLRGTYLNRGRSRTCRAFIYQHLLTMKETIEDVEKYYC